jgi:Putative Flp pilus-assembly TadE/G-like
LKKAPKSGSLVEGDRRSLVRVHKRDRDEGGQTLIFFVLAMPLFFAIIALVVDGSMVLVKKRALQNAADAAALAAAQDWPLGGPCVGACLATLQTSANNYSDKNGGPSLHPCNDPDPTHPTDTNCFAAPYVDKSGTAHDGQVEVRLTVSTPTLFTKAIGLKSLFDVSARSVAGSNPILGATTITGQTVTGSATTVVIPGGTHTTTDPSEVSGGTGIAFTMSRVCNAITYSGAGSGTWEDAIAAGFPGSASVLGAFATNGGVDFSGNAPKKMTWLGFDQTRCGNNPASPPSGTNQCKAKAWETPPGTGTDSNNLCVQTLVNLNKNGTLPITWPLPPPTPPTPLPAGTPFNPNSDYPSKCADPGTTSIGANWSNTHAPGIYCVSGSGTNLQFSSNGVDLTNGDGYTFFALGGATISTSGKNLKLKFYWPSGCNDPRPTTTRPPSYVCFGRTISDYDAETLLYATSTSSDGSCAVCLQGQNGNMTGDIFAPKPDAFPPVPTLTQTGGLVKVSGGGLSAGQGFIESWNLSLSGNTGTYSGTGASIVIPGAIHVTTDAGTTQTIIVPGTTDPGTTIATTIGTDIGLGE